LENRHKKRGVNERKEEDKKQDKENKITNEIILFTLYFLFFYLSSLSYYFLFHPAILGPTFEIKLYFLI